MDEVDPGPLGPVRASGAGLDGPPAPPARSTASAGASPRPAAARPCRRRRPRPVGAGALDRALVEQLEPDAHPEEGHAGRDGGSRAGASSPLSRSARAQAPKAPTPGSTTASAASTVAGVGDQARRCADVLERLLGRAQVADAVVEDGDARPSRHRLPLVEGMPPPSTRTASRRQRATPLKLASSMWWVFFPSSRRMCSVRLAAVAKARQNSSASWGSNGGVPRPGVSGANSSDVGQVGPTRQVERHLDERLVEGQQHGGEATDARLVAECLGQAAAEHDADVLDRVVRVDVQVARRRATVRSKPSVLARAARPCGRRRAGRSRPRSARCRRAPAWRRSSSPWWRGPGWRGGLVGGHRLSFKAWRKRSFSSGRADGDAQAAPQAVPAGAVADQDRVVEQRTPDLVARRGRGVGTG